MTDVLADGTSAPLDVETAARKAAAKLALAVSLAVADNAIVLATQDSQTIGPASDTASASFAAAFLAAVSTSSGADVPSASTSVAGYTLAASIAARLSS